jgi:hypothetical protein
MTTPLSRSTSGWGFACLALTAVTAGPAGGQPRTDDRAARDHAFALAAAQYRADEQHFADANLPHGDAALLDFVRLRLVNPARQKRIEELVARLASKVYREREQAGAELLKEGTCALPALYKVLHGDGELETKQLCDRCVKKIEAKAPNTLVLAAGRLLKARQTPGALAVLLEYAALAPNDEVEWEIFRSIYGLAVSGAAVEVFPPRVSAGHLDPLLLEALKDAEPARRAIAALAVARFGTAAQRQTVRPLLKDTDPKVRFRAAQGLLLAQDRAAVPALIDLLTTAPWHVAQGAEDMLTELAGDKGPNVALANALEARKACRDAWQTWWDAKRDGLDLAATAWEPPFGAEAERAAAGAVRFLRLFFQCDPDQVARRMELPFSIYGRLNFATREEIDIYLAAGKDIKLAMGGLRITVVGVLSAAEYLKRTDDANRRFLEGVRPAHLLVVAVDLADGPKTLEQKETHVLFMRVTGVRARCVGVGRPPRAG